MPVVDQFGDVLPNEDVDGNGIPFTMPIRHAGQYFDSEVGVFYNYFRDYDPATGRYVQSDPIGLQGGLNTYGYVGGNALGAVDPTGLLADGVTNACTRNPVFCAETGIMPAPPISAGAAASATANLVGAVASAADTAANAVADFNNRADGASIRVPQPPRDRNNYVCYCRINGLSDCGKMLFAYGWGISRDLRAAKRAAEAMAKMNLPAGTSNMHHPQCRCTDKKGDNAPPHG